METTKNAVETTTKRCPRCGQVKPVGEFHKKSKSKDGLQTYCKICQSEISHEQAMKRTEERRAKAASRETATPPNLNNTQSANPLERFTPRELIAELRRRGYKGELRYENIIKL